MKLSIMSFHELAMNRIITYQAHYNSSKFTNLPRELSWTSYELNWPSLYKFITVQQTLHMNFVN